jgi:hypothetical protein
MICIRVFDLKGKKASPIVGGGAVPKLVAAKHAGWEKALPPPPLLRCEPLHLFDFRYQSIENVFQISLMLFAKR